jgi:hypothetical protein
MRSRRFLALFSLLVAALLLGCSSAPNGAAAGNGADGGGQDEGGASSSGGNPQPGADGGPGSGCVPPTCASLGANCGSVPDSCGGSVTCGTCSGSGDSCGGGGTANVCGPGSCQAKTCAEAGKNCGQISDGCSAVLDCGSCTTGQTCGGGGSANVCGNGTCTPTSCVAQGKNCGTISDGCSGLLSCGGCSAGEVCGIGAEPNVCATPCPQGCPAGFTCGADGSCEGGDAGALALNVQSLAVSGTVTVNGAAPVATASCNDDYGVAQVTLVETTYGYEFTAIVPCASNAWTATAYPGTYRVSVTGEYSNIPSAPYVANPSLALTTSKSNVALDVESVTVSGTVSVNGAAPVATASCNDDYGVAEVTFVETTYGYEFTAIVPCASNAWTATVYPGTYRVSVTGEYSNIPSAPYVANPSLALTTSQSNVALDVQSVAVSGSVTVNGAAPVATASCNDDYGIAQVALLETTYGYSFSAIVPCESDAWTATIYPGTYRVTVQGEYSNIPPAAEVVVDRITLP